MRTNLVKNPSFEVDLTGWTWSSGAAIRTTSYGTQMWAGLGFRSGSWMLQATANGTSRYLTLRQAPATDSFAVMPGLWVGVSALVASDIPAPGRVRVDVQCDGTETTYHAEPVNAPSPFYAGRRVLYAFQVPATATTATLRIQGDSGSATLLASTNRIWADNIIAAAAATEAEALAAVTPYFDGSTPDTERVRYDWSGVAHASTSTATDWLDVSLVPAGSPQPVQIVLTGVPAGTAYSLTGTTGDGSSWPVPGGVGVSTGEQVVLVDNRSALNTQVTYQAVVAGVTYVSAPVTVSHSRRFVLQSLDGQIVVDFVWDDNGMPRDLVSNAVAFDVPGRRRPPIRYAPGGDGGGSLRIRTDRQDTERMKELLRKGRPLVLRTDGAIRDLDAVDLIQIVGKPSNVLWAGDGGVSTQRVWSLEYVLVDDPEPSAVLSAWTWDDFDAAMASRTWAQHDALFASSTWDQWDTYPWGQLL